MIPYFTMRRVTKLYRPKKHDFKKLFNVVFVSLELFGFRAIAKS